jgi:hypothetical protein
MTGDAARAGNPVDVDRLIEVANQLALLEEAGGRAAGVAVAGPGGRPGGWLIRGRGDGGNPLPSRLGARLGTGILATGEQDTAARGTGYVASGDAGQA